jgi:hypothetical protein
MFSEKINELFLEYFIYIENEETLEEINSTKNDMKQLFLLTFAEFLKNVWRLVPLEQNKTMEVLTVNKLRNNIFKSFAVELFMALKSLKNFNIEPNSPAQVSTHCSLLLNIINDKIIRTPVNQVLKKSTKILISNCLEHCSKLLQRNDPESKSSDDLTFQRFIIFLNKSYSKMPSLVRKSIETSPNGMEGLIECSLNWRDDVGRLSGLFFISKLSSKSNEDIIMNINEIFQATNQLLVNFISVSHGSLVSKNNSFGDKSLKRLKGDQKSPLSSFLTKLTKQFGLENLKNQTPDSLKEEAIRICINILSNLFKGVSGLAEPFIFSSLMLSSLLIEQYVKTKPADQKLLIQNKLKKSIGDLVDNISSEVDFRICLKHALTLIESGKQYFSFEVFSNASLLVKKIIKGMSGELFAEKKNVLHMTLLNGLENLSSLLIENHLKRADSYSSMEEHLSLFCQKILEKKNQNEVSSGETIFKNLWTDAYLGFALKCNEEELKEFFKEIKKWALKDTSNNSDPKNKLNSQLMIIQKQKIMVEILNKIISKISFMGISLYEEVLQLYVDFQDRVIELSKLVTTREEDISAKLSQMLNPVEKELEDVIVNSNENLLENDLSDFEEEESQIEEAEEIENKPLLGKRGDSITTNSNESIIWKVFIIKNFEFETLILDSLKLLFENDEGSFMDAFKFEGISSQLMKLVSTFRISDQKEQNLCFFENCTFPVISSLLKLVSGNLFYK